VNAGKEFSQPERMREQYKHKEHHKIRTNCKLKSVKYKLESVKCTLKGIEYRSKDQIMI
jgi:hypothetical protein